MNQLLPSALTLLLVLPLSWSPAFAQSDFPDFDDLAPVPGHSLQTAITPPQDPPGQHQPVFSQAELDQMLAPIALYPDSLLSQILMASTYPLEVIEAARWSAANPNMEGEQAVQALSDFSWDPSVKALVAFPQILAVMDEKLTWMERLGDAFLSQREQVMETIQSLRQKAADAGNLVTDDHLRVTQAESIIGITPANPQLVYVPYYDPMLIYGPWWWPAYQPVYWPPWAGYYVGRGVTVGFTWGLGTHLGSGWLWSGFRWPSYQVIVGGNRIWIHDSFHRRGVHYRDMALHRQYGRMSASSGIREHFDGFETPALGGHSGFDYRPDMRFGSRERFRQPGSARFQTPGVPNRPPTHYEFSRRHLSPSNRPQSISPGSIQRPFNARGPSHAREFAPPSDFAGRGSFQAGSHFRGGGEMHGGGGFRGDGGLHRGGNSHRGGGGHRR